MKRFIHSPRALLARALPACALLAGIAAPAPEARAQATSGQEKQILTMTRDNWVSFRDYQGQQLVYFTHLEAWRCGIATVRYSINSDALDREWTLQPCDPDNPNAVTTGTPYVALPPGTARSVSVQLTFKDGSTSDIVRATP